MNSSDYSELLWTIAAFSGVGAVIDFLLGRAGQKRVREWLEINWYRYSDVKWGDLGKGEADAFVRITDALFGARLLSARRALSTLLVAALAATPALLSFVFPQAAISGSTRYGSILDLVGTETVQVAMCGLAFALSISLSRTMARLSALFYGNSSILNLVLLVSMLAASYLVLVIWAPAYGLVINLLALYVHSVVAGDPQMMSLGDILGMFPETVSVWIEPSALWTPSYMWNHIVNGYLGCSNPPCPGWLPSDIGKAMEEALLSLGGVFRIGMYLLFVVVFALEWTFRKTAFLIWARIVESEKPVFTLVFGGCAAIAKFASDVIKHYAS